MTSVWITLGPTSLDSLQELVAAGVRAVRLTFSFGDFALQLERADMIRQASGRAGFPCAVVADLPGGKPRLGMFTGGSSTVSVNAGESFTIVDTPEADPRLGSLPLPNGSLLDRLVPGTEMIIGDGAAVLRVESVGGGRVEVAVVSGGIVEHTRGITLRGNDAVEPVCLTPKDLDWLDAIADSDCFDAVALSFVGSPRDVEVARVRLGGATPVVAKIESRAGMKNLDEICCAADMVMAARGDLALAMPWADLPGAVSAIAAASERTATPWVLATQVFEGLNEYFMPTRAEIGDLAHWLEKGCDGVMLSRETAFGPRPLEAVTAVQVMIDRWRPVP